MIGEAKLCRFEELYDKPTTSSETPLRQFLQASMLSTDNETQDSDDKNKEVTDLISNNHLLLQLTYHLVR